MVANSEWRQALCDVPRELFIPELIWVEDEQVDGYVAVCRSENPRRWGELVAADDAVVTQVDDGRTVPGSVGRSPSSAGSKPSIVADMLSALDVHPGHAVLEIGTGTGWNAALLSERVGETGRVVSVEIDANLAVAARTALHRADYQVPVITVDGVAGYPPGAPYDRILSTAAVRHDVPGAWVTPNAARRADRNALGNLVSQRHSATAAGRRRQHRDRLVRWKSGIHEAADATRPQLGNNEDLDGADFSKTTLSSPEIGEAVASFDGSFAVGLHVPDCRVHVDEDAADGQHLVSLSDGQSLARVVVEVGGDFHQVHQCGPRRLWDEVAFAYDWWRDAGKPPHTRFGVTVTPDDQVIWLDDPANTVSHR